MDQLHDYADERLIRGCIYCGGLEDTRDHVPSRVFLDPPLPENLPVVAACRSCNNGFSQDEEYLACLIESVVAGSTDPDVIRRSRVADILRRSPALRARIEAAKASDEQQTSFGIEPERVQNVLLKLARGHAAFELSQPCSRQPSSVRWWPHFLMTASQLDLYDAAQVDSMWGEVGSRGQQRQMITQLALESASGKKATLGLLVNDWVDVQDGRYRYHAMDAGGAIRVKIVIGEYLASEVVWTQE